MGSQKTWLYILFALTVSGCATPAEIKDVTEAEVRDIPLGQKTKPLQFKKIVIKMRRGTKIGAWEVGLLCIPQGELKYRGGKISFGGDELSEVFREELEKANYTLVGDPNLLFDDPSTWKAQFLIAGLVKDMKANICYPYSGFGNMSSANAQAYVKVEWQIYSRLDRKVVYKVTTEGSSKSDETSDTAAMDAFMNAFAGATRGLIADRKFYDLVTGAAGDDIRTEKPSSRRKARRKKIRGVTIRKSAHLYGSVASNMSRLRSGVVTVFAGGGHGSGFFIGRKGYLLTNQHVVRGAEVVKIKMYGGKEMVGKVLKTNARRDVALIKLKMKSAQPLPISIRRPSVGSTVYAVGTPVQEKWDLTVSKGVLSSYRTDENGYDFVQSDVTILPGSSGGPLLNASGNVVGMAVKGLSMGKAFVGLNFFIPIKEALASVNVKRR